MLKLFGAPNRATGNKKPPAHQPDVQYTRFYYRNARAAPAPQAVEQAGPVKLSPVPAAPQGRKPNEAGVQPPKLDENAQLYSEARISISVLRKALPMRFAVMDC